MRGVCDPLCDSISLPSLLRFRARHGQRRGTRNRSRTSPPVDSIRKSLGNFVPCTRGYAIAVPDTQPCPLGLFWRGASDEELCQPTRSIRVTDSPSRSFPKPLAFVRQQPPPALSICDSWPRIAFNDADSYPNRFPLNLDQVIRIIDPLCAHAVRERSNPHVHD